MVREESLTVLCSLSNRQTRWKQREIWKLSCCQSIPSRVCRVSTPFWWCRRYNCVSPELFCNISSTFTTEQRSLQLIAALFMPEDNLRWLTFGIKARCPFNNDPVYTWLDCDFCMWFKRLWCYDAIPGSWKHARFSHFTHWACLACYCLTIIFMCLSTNTYLDWFLFCTLCMCMFYCDISLFFHQVLVGVEDHHVFQKISEGGRKLMF